MCVFSLAGWLPLQRHLLPIAVPATPMLFCFFPFHFFGTALISVFHTKILSSSSSSSCSAPCTDLFPLEASFSTITLSTMFILQLHLMLLYIKMICKSLQEFEVQSVSQCQYHTPPTGGKAEGKTKTLACKCCLTVWQQGLSQIHMHMHTNTRTHTQCNGNRWRE